jgi:hypothetical protein
MKKNIYLFIVLVPQFIFAQATLQISENVTVNASFDINKLIEIHQAKNEKTDEMPGYRIQLLSNNERSIVNAKRSEFSTVYSDLKTYIQYDQPYYRLKVGDLKTRVRS